MLPRAEAPARRLPYTTADIAERLAKKKAEQEAAAQALANQALRFGVTNPPAVKKDEPWYKDALGAVGGAIKYVYNNAPSSNPISTPINMGGDAGVSMGGQGTGKSLVTEPARLAVRRAVGDITAIPRVGADSPSYTADKIREQGVARGVLGAAIDYSQFIPVVAKGAGVTGDLLNAYRLARMERIANPFPALRYADDVIDVVEGSRLPARVVEPPATPATRLAQAQTTRALPPSVQRALPPVPPERLAQLQREATRAEMGISIDDIEFPPQGSMSTIAKASEDIANAEIYATEIAVREGRVKPGWDLRTKLNWPEFKKPYYEFIANARATQTAFDSYDHIHPEAWIEIGEAQRNSGFTYDQMPNEMRAIQQYFSNAYGKIQEYLSVKSYDPLLSNENFSPNTQQYALYQGREKVFGEFEELIGNIDRAFRVVPPVTRPFTTYRGVSISNAADPYVIAFYRNLKPGDLIYDPAYSSTSINKTLAEQWAGRPDDVVLIIQIPKGTSVVHPISTWTEGMGEFKYHDNAPNEKELLLDRNSTFRVIRNDGKFIEVELVPSNTSVTNVRTVNKETAKTMSFEDALAKVQDETVRQLITNPISTPFNPLVKGFNQDLPEGEFFS